MFTLPNPIIITQVSRYQRHEIHIIEGPTAIISFVAVDADGKRVQGAPVAVFTLRNKAYNEFYSAWSSEAALYSKCLDLVTLKVPGASISGVDLPWAVGMTIGEVAEVLDLNPASS